MYLPPDASKARIREAENARRNRAEIVRARSIGQVTRRDLFKWGIFTGTGLLAAKHGLSHLVSSAYASVPTGAPRSPLFGAQKFKYELRRLEVHEPCDMTPDMVGNTDVCRFGGKFNETHPAKQFSYHNEFDVSKDPLYRNPITGIGPCEGRPSGAAFAHQRWSEFKPKKGYVMTWGQVAPGFKFHPDFPVSQDPNSVWTFGAGRFTRGTGPFLLKMRYGESVLTRVYNGLPTAKEANNGFGRNECQFHFHNAHNGAESDGATGAHHFPGTFYDYLWGTCLARRDKINTGASDPRASGPDGNGGVNKVPGDFREIQGTLWAHDHRSFFTAENVYKGNLGMVNMYSGPDRGNEELVDKDKVNLRLPSGWRKDWGNIDFDVNLIVSDAAWDQNGQLFFDIFTTDGFLGDVPLVNFQYAPKMSVLPRKYRFRILSGGMSRFLKLAIASPTGTAVPMTFIANDGNFVVNPITLTVLDEQSTAERYDIIVDFSKFKKGDKLHLVNTLKQTDGRKPDGAVSLSQALKGDANDPVLGAIMQFVIADSVPSIDEPGQINFASRPDASQVPAVLTEQIPIVAPVRERVVEFGRGDGDSRRTATGQCSPDCADSSTSFPWIIKVNGQAAHSFNSNRISQLIPKSGEVEHWTYINGGGGWDHPIHLHFEEGITMSRPGGTIPKTELLVRKDVWRLRPSGKVKFQVQFGEFGGSYVNHCHNTVHEDFAMLMRIQLLTQRAGQEAQSTITMTPLPTPEGVKWMRPELLPEGNPANAQFFTGKI